MKDIKLSGLKQLRIKNGLTLNSLATKLNLISPDNINYIITPEYLEKLEKRKQREIDDNLLELLQDFFSVSFNELKDGVPDEKLTRKVKLKHPLSDDRTIETYIDVSNKIPDSFIALASEKFLENFMKEDDEDSFILYTKHLSNFLAALGSSDKYEEELNDLEYAEWFIDDVLFKNNARPLIDIMKLAEIMLQELHPSGMPEDVEIKLICGLLKMYLDEGLI